MTCGLSIANNLDIKDILVAGVDGYSGYFVDDSNEKFHMTGAFNNSRNLELPLHSTSNPDLGRPTVPECFADASNSFEIMVSSHSSILARTFPIWKKHKK